jgi:hypothetical protein
MDTCWRLRTHPDTLLVYGYYAVSSFVCESETDGRWHFSFVISKRRKWKCNYYEGHLERKERFAIKKYLLIIGKKKNMQVLSHTFTYFST